jgi:hypothetical protein
MVDKRMDPTFDSRVREQFSRFLEDGRLDVVESRHYPEAFGDAFVTLEGCGVRVRVLLERGTLDVVIARQTAPDDWYSLEHAIAVVGGPEPHRYPLGLSEFADLLSQFWSPLVEGFGPRWPSMEEGLRHQEKLGQARLAERAKARHSGRRRKKDPGDPDR